MAKYCLCLILFFISAIVVNGSCPGCPSDLSEDDKQSEHLKSISKEGVDKIYQKKLQENSLPSCVLLDGKILSGTKQVVAGFKYILKVEVSPVQSHIGECAAANADISAVPKEVCEIEIWEKPGGEEKEISFQCPAPQH